MQVYQIFKVANLGHSQNQTGYVLKRPRGVETYQTIEEVKAKFNGLRKRDWVLFFQSENGEYIVYTNKPNAHKGCVVCDKI